MKTIIISEPNKKLKDFSDEELIEELKRRDIKPNLKNKKNCECLNIVGLLLHLIKICFHLC